MDGCIWNSATEQKIGGIHSLVARSGVRTVRYDERGYEPQSMGRQRRHEALKRPEFIRGEIAEILFIVGLKAHCLKDDRKIDCVGKGEA